MEPIIRDVRLAVRRLRMAPGFTGFAVVSLALGIGVTTAIYSAVRTLLWTPLGIVEPPAPCHGRRLPSISTAHQEFRMTFKTTVWSGLMLVAWLSAPVSAAAECVRLPAKDMATVVMEDKGIELVFSGTVVAASRTAELGYRVTFDVERIWKGPVTKHFDLYVWELRSENPSFTVGQNYVALATRLATSPSGKASAYPVLTRSPLHQFSAATRLYWIPILSDSSALVGRRRNERQAQLHVTALVARRSRAAAKARAARPFMASPAQP